MPKKTDKKHLQPVTDDTVRIKIATLGITDNDIADAITWSRKQYIVEHVHEEISHGQ